MNDYLEQPRKKEPAKPEILQSTKVTIGSLDAHFTPAWFKQDFPHPDLAQAIENRRPNVSGKTKKHITGLWWLVTLDDGTQALYNEKELAAGA